MNKKDNIQEELRQIFDRLQAISLSLATRHKASIEPGDRVKVLHQYRSRKGLIGIVIQTTPCFAYVQFSSSKELHRIHKHNLRRLRQND